MKPIKETRITIIAVIGAIILTFFVFQIDTDYLSSTDSVRQQAIERRERWLNQWVKEQQVRTIPWVTNDFYITNQIQFIKYPAVEWQGQVFDGIEYGLHPNGMVMWRKKEVK